jgi:NADH dehydrogenase/NADH:ubiquinone oxidoreductase subunit G
MTDERAKEVVRLVREVESQMHIWLAAPERYEEALCDAADELERLRKENADLRESVHGQAASEAAADAQRYLFAKDAEIARLREALKPFAALWEGVEKFAVMSAMFVRADLHPDDLKRAAEVLK